MHSLLVKSLNLFSAWIFHNFPKCKILKGKKCCFKERYGLVLQALKLCYLIFLSSLAGDISPLLVGRWCLNGKQRDERKWSSTGSCQTDALWNATELVWSIISPFSVTENIDKVSPQKVESSRWENYVHCGNIFTETLITAISIPLLARRFGPILLKFFIKWPILDISLMDTLEIWQNEVQQEAIQNPLFFSLALVIPHPALMPPLSLVRCWICSSCFSVRTAHTACGAAVSRASSGASPGAAGQLIQLCPSLGPWRALLPFAGPAVAWGGQYFRGCFCSLGYSCWHSRLHSPKQSQQSIKAERWYQPLSVLTTQSHKWKNFCSKQPRLLYYLFLFFFTIHPSITWNFHWNQQDLQYLFFLVGNTVYSDHPILLPLPGDLAEWMLMK